jgi:Ca2+-binding EF-hand superfamily protein
MKKLIIITAVGLSIPFLAQADNAAMLSSEASVPAFEAVDTDKDGKITRQEASSFSALEITFDSADSNKDGVLDADELARSRQADESKK